MKIQSFIALLAGFIGAYIRLSGKVCCCAATDIIRTTSFCTWSPYENQQGTKGKFFDDPPALGVAQLSLPEILDICIRRVVRDNQGKRYIWSFHQGLVCRRSFWLDWLLDKSYPFSEIFALIPMVVCHPYWNVKEKTCERDYLGSVSLQSSSPAFDLAAVLDACVFFVLGMAPVAHCWSYVNGRIVYGLNGFGSGCVFSSCALTQSSPRQPYNTNSSSKMFEALRDLPVLDV